MLGFAPLASSTPASPGEVDYAVATSAPTAWTWTGDPTALEADFEVYTANVAPWTWTGGNAALLISYSQSFTANIPMAGWTWAGGSAALTASTLAPHGLYRGKLIKTPVFLRGFGVRYQ